MAKIKRTVDGLAIITPYSASFLAQLKRLVPANERRWQKPAWIVDPKHEQAMISLVKSCFDSCQLITEDTKENIGGLVHIETRRAKVYYIGSCKPRDGGPSAFGWTGGDWNIIFPESVLRDYFKAGPVKNQPSQDTLYSLLGIESIATPEQVKSAYRRAARQWHPDVNHDPDAPQLFRRLSDAYQVLSNARQRKRYDAGLALENGNDKSDSFIITDLQSLYRAPYTCGLIRFKGRRSLGRWIVDEIVSWDDIKNEQGQIMVSSWDKTDNTFKVSWINDFEVEI
jgi:hypothetical protein